MTWHVVRKAHQEKGAAFEDEEEAGRLRRHWDALYEDDYEVVEREDPGEDEIAAGEATAELDDLLRSLGL